MSKELKKRSEVLKENTWATEDLYPTDQSWQEDLEKAKTFKERILNFKGKLGESSQSLLDFYQLYDEVDILFDNLFNYASRKKDEDTKNSTYQALNGSLMSVDLDS
jgi:oligoendopeptidase F